MTIPADFCTFAASSGMLFGGQGFLCAVELQMFRPRQLDEVLRAVIVADAVDVMDRLMPQDRFVMGVLPYKNVLPDIPFSDCAGMIWAVDEHIAVLTAIPNLTPRLTGAAMAQRRCEKAPIARVSWMTTREEFGNPPSTATGTGLSTWGDAESCRADDAALVMALQPSSSSAERASALRCECGSTATSAEHQCPSMPENLMPLYIMEV